MKRLVLAALSLLAVLAAPVHAASGGTLTRVGQTVTWSGSLAAPDITGCGDVASRGCDSRPLTVIAPRGALVTVWVEEEGSYLRVEQGGTYVASNGQHTGLRSSGPSSRASTTFEQVRSGRVTYTVGVSSLAGGVGGATPYTAHARLGGKAVDREGECFVGDGGLAALQAEDDGAVLPLSLRLVTAPADAAEVRRKVIPAVIETYARIGVRVRVSLDVRPLRPGGYPYEQVRQAYGGRRPAGVDVVHVVSDLFAGGYGDCIGGVAYPERAFSTGALHYAPEGTVTVPTVPAAVIVAHEVGHLLGAQHQMASCAEAAGQQVQQRPSDGPCTVMSPAAVQAAEVFSTWERAAIRSYVRRYARG